MRCAGVAECGAWLAPGGLRLDADLALLDAGQWARFPERYYLIDRPDLDLPEFSRQLLDWLPVGRERLLMVSRWSADPPDHPHVFNAIRAGAGADQPLRAAPGHIFAASKEDGADYDERPALDVAEESIAMWLMGLMLEWTWEGYATVAGCADALWLGDGFVRFLASDARSHAAALAMMRESNLKYAVKYPWGAPGR